MPEPNELNESCSPPILCRAEPDDEYPQPEPEPDPELIDEHRYEDEIDDDEEDEKNYSS